MAKQTYQNIKGTFDILPETTGRSGTHEFPAAAWRHVEATVREVMECFNMEEIRTPVLEPTELIARGVGEETDIVSKEMFAFQRGDTKYVLRPEVTAPVMRAYLQHHLEQRGGAQKLYYIGPCFRAEQPQKGRYRQFHQFGCEVIGAADPVADAEVIAAMMAVYEAFGVTDTILRINTLGTPGDRRTYAGALRNYMQAHTDVLSETSRRRLDTNPLRVLDTKIPEERALLDEAPRLVDYVSDDSRQQYGAVKDLLNELEIAYEEDPFLVRGLDYYTHTTFELESPDLGAQSALAGGGRYDLLAETLGSKKRVPAIGFAAGVERLFIALMEQKAPLPRAAEPDVFLASLGEAAGRWALHTAVRLRREGLRVGIDVMGRSLRAQMREADRQNARYTLIVGDNELEAGRVQVKEMRSGEQEEVRFDGLADYLLGRNSATVGA